MPLFCLSLEVSKSPRSCCVSACVPLSSACVCECVVVC